MFMVNLKYKQIFLVNDLSKKVILFVVIATFVIINFWIFFFRPTLVLKIKHQNR